MTSTDHVTRQDACFRNFIAGAVRDLFPGFHYDMVYSDFPLPQARSSALDCPTLS